MAPSEARGAQHWVVVGAGSAGCVLANRLSQDPDCQVTLIDDGPDLTSDAVPAGISGSSFFDAVAAPGRLHHDLVATRVSGGEPSLYQRGRGVGGSSTINAMVALHGDPAQYADWGWHDTGEAWERVSLPENPPTHDELGPIDRALLDSDDRASIASLTRIDGRRVTSAEAYLWPVLDRPNLRVRANAAVEALLMDRRRAVGVGLVGGSAIAADRVVVSAGAIHSPALLLRSGIDTPGIGTGLQDHPAAVLTLKPAADVETAESGLVVGSVLHAEIGAASVQLLPLNHLGPDPGATGLAALMAAVMNPRSRAGTVRVDSGGRPVVDFALLHDRFDVDALVAAAELALDMVTRPAFAEIVDQVFIDDRGTTADTLTDRGAIEAWVQSRCADYVHASSSCAMGQVVDDDFAVIGYDGLFVCDASIFPSIPRANTHLPTTMAAERFALRHC